MRGATVFEIARYIIYYISIHAPREGSDQDVFSARLSRWRFLSTLPVRGATVCRDMTQERAAISIHAPREGSDVLDAHAIQDVGISIHAPREGSDPGRRKVPQYCPYFYPRSP